MTWKVVWKPEAERRLAAVWLLSNDRDRISAAAYQLDESLSFDPEGAGESRSGNRRIVLVPPLGALVAVYPDLRTVVVLTVWDF